VHLFFIAGMCWGYGEEEVDRLTVRPVLPRALRPGGERYLAGPVAVGKGMC